MATKTTSLGSLTALKAYLKIQSGNTTQDAILSRLGDAISENIESWTNRIFVTRNVVEYYDGDGRDRLKLRSYPVKTLNSLKTRWTLFDSFVTVQSTDYELDDFHGIVYYRGVIGPNHQFPFSPRSILIDADYGFDIQDGPLLPQDIVMAYYDWCKFVYGRWSSDVVLATNASSTGKSISVGKKPPADIADLLDGWRKVRL